MTYISNFWTDIRESLRSVWKQPYWTALLVLVLCAGMTCMLFVTAIANTLIFRPLPFANAEQLYVVGPLDSESSEVQYVAERDYWALKNQLSQQSESGSISIAATGEGTMYLNFGTQTERFSGAFVSPNFLDVLGASPKLGPAFRSEDANAGALPKLVISHQVWMQYFLGDVSVIGRSVRLNGKPAEIVAVMPEHFSYPRNSQLWTVSATGATPVGARDDDRYVQMLARVSNASALPGLNNALGLWKKQLDQERVDILGENSMVLARPAHRQFVDAETRQIIGLMLIATTLILLLACMNAASLMLSLKLGRTHELAVRLALGASRFRIARLLFADSLVLVALSTVVSLGLGNWLVNAMIDTMRRGDDGGPPLWMRFDIDAGAVGLAIIVGLISAMAAGLWPAVKLSAQASTALRSGARTSTAGMSRKFSGLMIVLELACAAALLIGSLNLANYVNQSFKFDLGVRTENRMSARIGLFETQYPTPEKRLALYRDLMQRLRADPQVIDATLSTSLPGLMGDNRDMLPVASTSTTFENIAMSVVDVGFQNTMQQRLLQGRWFTSADTANGAQVAVVDEKFVQQYAKNSSPIGQQFVLSPKSPYQRTVTVVGVVEALTLEDASDTPEPVMLVPLGQEVPSFISIIAHHRPGGGSAVQQRMVSHMRALDADTPLYWQRNYESVIRDANIDEAVLAWTFNAFSVIAILLAVSGLFGLVAFNVSQRTRELGLRKAIGASNGTLVRSLMSNSLIHIGAGLVLGALLGVPFASMLLHTMDENALLNHFIVVAVFVLLAMVALAAALIPAWRALSISPTVALRQV